MARVEGPASLRDEAFPILAGPRETQKEGGRNSACGLKGTQPGHTGTVGTAASHPCAQERASGCQVQQTPKLGPHCATAGQAALSAML